MKMQTVLACFGIVLIGIHPGAAQDVTGASIDMTSTARASEVPISPNLEDLTGFDVSIPTNLLADVAQKAFTSSSNLTRSAKDVQLYRAISPSVVLIVHKEGLGSGSLISAAGDVLTNYHVVRGYSTVAVVFKPAVEGAEPSKDDIKIGQVIKYDETADLALIKVRDAVGAHVPIRLGSSDEIAVGADVHAIGHPTGEAWTYTTGVVSQYRLNFKWNNKDDSVEHRADIIQTQTPINPGNSGGPLIGDSGNLIGVNSFKGKGEGLNFAVSVDDVKRFLLRPSGPTANNSQEANRASCKPKALNKYRNSENTSSVTAYDMFCDGKTSGEYVLPDDPKAPSFLRVDRNGDGKADVIFFETKRSGKWEISFWDEKYNGQWSLVGYHDDGTLTASRFESYATFKKRLASNQ